MFTRIILTGDLAERFTPEFHADISTPKEAIACLIANFSDFQNYILGDEDNRYRLTVSDAAWSLDITPENNLFPCQGKTITIAPVLSGSGGGIGKLLTGVLLIGVGILTGGTGLIIAGALTVISSFFGNPDKPDDENGSLVFTGPATTVAEGNRIPLIYGKKFRVGVQVISSGIKSEYNAR